MHHEVENNTETETILSKRIKKDHHKSDLIAALKKDGTDFPLFPRVCVTYKSDKDHLKHFAKILLQELRFWTHVIYEEKSKTNDTALEELNYACYLTVKGFYIAVKGQAEEVTAIDKKAFEYLMANYRRLRNKNIIALAKILKKNGELSADKHKELIEKHSNKTKTLEEEFA